MAFLLPENLPSRNNVSRRLQSIARAARDNLPEEVTVWLKEEEHKFLVLLDPAAGILVIEAPPERSRQARRRKFTPEAKEVRQQVAEELKNLGRGAQAEPIASLPVKNVLALPDTKRGGSLSVELAEAGETVLFAEDLASSAFRGAIGRILSNQGGPLTEEQEKAARAAVNPKIVIKKPVRDNQLVFSPPGDEEDVFAVMDRQQERLAEYLGPGYRRIRGVAGSGKTLVLLHRARFIARHFPQYRVLLLCFNRALSLALQELAREHKNITVQTVDSLAKGIAGHSGKKFNLKTEDGWERLRQEALKMVSHWPADDLYHLVLVDEAQDLRKSHLDLAYAMVRPGHPEEKDFVVAYDSAQDIYRRRTLWNPPELTARGRSSIMTVNYRNTREILEFAMNFLTGSSDWTDGKFDPDDETAVVPPEASRRTGLPPRVVACADTTREAAEVAERVSKHLERGASPDDVAVIYGNSSMVTELMQAFTVRNISFAHIFSGGKENVINAKGKVRIANLYQFKGLEFGAVFICGANMVRVPGGEDDIHGVKSLLYVGMTRAQDELTVTYSGAGEVGEALQRAQVL